MNILQRSIGTPPVRRFDEMRPTTPPTGTEALSRVLPTERWTDKDALLDAFERGMEECGVDHWMVAGVPMPSGDLRQTIIRARWPETWMQRYLREDFAKVDPVLIAAVGSRMAMSEQEIVAATAHLPRSAAILGEYAAAGLRNHGAVPVIRVGQYHAVVTFASERPLTDDTREIVFTIARRMVDRLHHLAPELLFRTGQLTARERQIVTLTAEGKTSNEIAAELGISARTVFAHLTAAGDKLRAANKTECVVNAYRHGQIAL